MFLYEIKKALEEYKYATNKNVFMVRISMIKYRYSKKSKINNEYKISKIIDEIFELPKQKQRKLLENIEIIENIPDLSYYEYLKIKKTLVNLNDEDYNEKFKNYINLLDTTIQNIH